MTERVVDSSVVLAMLKGEVGASAAAGVIPGSLVSAVNHAEIISKLTEWGGAADASEDAYPELVYRVADFTRDLAHQAGLLRAVTKSLGLSLGDRACLALARREKLPAYTMDRRWVTLDIGVDIKILR